ncbi:hypothetical protein ACFQVA_05395 [Actinomadura keratinilytica]
MDTAPPELLPAHPAELRRWRREDAGALHRVIRESREHLVPWMPWAAGQGPRETAEFLGRCDEEWESGEAYMYALTAAGRCSAAAG